MKKKNEEFAKIKQLAFIQGREYQRRMEQKNFTHKHIIEAGKKMLKNLPSKQYPDDGYGDEYNAGFNDALDAVGKLIIDFFQ